MTDYELYQLLEENGYETSNENLKVFKEGLESGKILLEKHTKHWKAVLASKNTTEDQKEIARTHLNHEVPPVNDHVTETAVKEVIAKRRRKEEGAEESDFAIGKKLRARQNISTGTSEKPFGRLDYLDKYGKRARDKATVDLHKAKERRGPDAKPTDITESYFSDYELYQLLEENGYEPSKENLIALIEGLNSGDIELLDETKDIHKFDAAVETMPDGEAKEEARKLSPSKKKKEIRDGAELLANDKSRKGIEYTLPTNKKTRKLISTELGKSIAIRINRGDSPEVIQREIGQGKKIAHGRGPAKRSW